jgi:PAS domain S-box-containing protein
MKTICIIGDCCLADLKASKEAKAIRVLHVDDDASLREIFKLILLDLDGGFEIEQACCVDEGLSKLSVGCYDVVVSDYEMPQKDGLQFLKELREQQNDTPFILFTGRGREEVAIKALNLGADGYYNKQGNPETVYGELAHGIIQLVSQNRLREKLFAEEERFRQLFSNTPMAAAIYEVINGGEDFVFKDINSAAERIEKIEKASVLGERVTNVFPGVKNFGIFEVFKRVSKTGKAEYFPDAIYQDSRDTGSWRENWVIKLPNDNIAAIYNDITERKKAETELKATFEVLERVGESIDAGLAVIGKDYRVVWANKRLMDLGVAPNKKCYQTFNCSEIICKDCGAKKIFEQNISLDVHEFKTVNSKGETTWVELRVTPLKDKERKVTAALELAVPITERKKAVDALEESHARYRDLADSLPEIVFETDIKGKLIYANERAFEITGYSKENFAKGICVFDLLRKEDEQRAKENFSKILTNNPYKDNEYTFVKKDGSTFQAIIVSRPIVVDNQTIGLRGIVVDITQRKKVEGVLRESEKKYRTLVEQSTHGILIAQGNIPKLVFVNSAFSKVLGYSVQELLSLSPQQTIELVYSDDRDLFFKRFKERLEGKPAPSQYTIRGIRKDGTIVWLEMSSALIEYGGQPAVQAMFADITERKKVLDALRASEERYKAYVENSPVAFFVANAEGKYEQVNEAACKLLGYDRNELLEMTIFNILFEKDVSLGLKQFVSLKETGKTLFDVSLKRKDGKPVYVILNATKLPDGRLMAFCENISERKKSEEKLKENSQRIELMNEKLNVVGSLTRHDVGNKLMVANSNLFLLRKMIGDKPEFAKYFDGINSALESANRIFEFSRFCEQIGAEEPSKENVFECFNQAAALLPNLGSVKVVNECGELVVMADSMLKQIFYNFIDNSLKHGEKVTQIRLHYSKEREELKLFYEDNGVGVSETNKPKIFNSGFTTRGSSGLGLSLVKKMIEFYGWTITEEGEAGKGAKFVISIPLSLFSGSEKNEALKEL